jgi:aspartate kinase
VQPIVCKFGGSSLADADQFRKAAQIVRAEPARRFVVPSAPGRRTPDDQKVTDLLYLCHELALQKVPIDPVFGRVRERVEQIATDLGLDLDTDALLSPIGEQIQKHGAAGDPADTAASRGEWISAHLLGSMLDAPVVDAAQLVRFDDRGRLDEPATYAAVADRLGPMDRAIVPGFYGSTPDGAIRTFSRGGSDISGAIVARGVQASLYENWTDVSGLLMADPRIVDRPRTIATLTYRELRELSYSGATVLHDEAVFPVRDGNIPVQVRNTNRPDDPGTRIVPHDADHTSRGAITGIAGRTDFTVIGVEKARMNSQLGFGRRALGVLERHGISFEHMPSGIDTLSIVVADSEVAGKLDAVVDELQRELQPDAVDVSTQLALVAVVGRGMARTPGMAARAFAALADAKVNIRMIDQGSSELNIIVGVDVGDYETAVRAIYQTFSPV